MLTIFIIIFVQTRDNALRHYVFLVVTVHSF